MIVAVDARELTGRPAGVGRYLSELLKQWATSDEGRRHEWRLYAHTQAAIDAPFAQSLRLVPGNGGTRWEQWTFMRTLARERPDVLFAPGYTAPLTAPCPTVLTLHDVSFTAHPEWFASIEGARRRTLAAASARRARLVLTDSEFSKREIVERIGIPESRVRAIPLGMRSSGNRGFASPEVAREPLVLYVGSIFNRRHVDHLIRAFAESVATRVPGSRLEIVGHNRTHPHIDFDRMLAEVPPDIRTRITMRAYVDEPTLASLYARATVFAFLSEYEGFGLTPLEAMAAGVPPVVLDTPVAREVYGDAARLVTLDSAGAEIAQLLTDDAMRQQLSARAQPVLARYDWTRTAAATLAAIKEGAGV